MVLDVNTKATELLARLANSIYDRDPTTSTPFFFSSNEVQIVEKWIEQEIKKPAKEGHRLSNTG